VGATAADYGRTPAEQQVFGRNQLLLSGLVLARPATATADDGVLTAEEVGGLDLRGTELVTLSACETGLGNTAGGEGVLGLQRAFPIAGARGVLASLWRVDDAATVVLMQEFYTNLWQEPKLPAWEALRQAQLTVLRHPERVAQCADELRTRGVTPGKGGRPGGRPRRPPPARRAP